MSRKKWTEETLFARLLNNKSDKTHWENIRELRSRGSKEVFIKSVELINSDIAKERLIGAEILSQLGLPPRPFIKQTFEIFFELLKTETNNLVISTMFYGIGHNSEHLKKKDIDFICTFKDNKNIEIKQGLVFALCGIDDNSAIDTLIDFTKDKRSSIRDWATFGIGVQSDRDDLKIRAALWNRVSDKHFKTRREAIFGLAKRKDKRIKEILKKELETIDNHGSYMLEAIEEFQDKDFIDLLKQKIISNEIDKKINPEWLENSIRKLMEIQ
ncbi:MAG: hypothetical protein V4714_13445 [Bacteroidota bacterium]